MKRDVIRLRPPISDEISEKLSRQDVATVHEVMGQRRTVTHSIRSICQGVKLCGRALIIKCHTGDNFTLIKAISMAQKDDVIVADMDPLADNEPFGEVLGVGCQSHGVNGLMVTCGIRDTEALGGMDFPVFPGGVSVFGTSKAVKGTINYPVVVGGVLVYPGDVILGDWDGIAIIPCEEAVEVLRLADMCRGKKKGVMERLHRGESLFDMRGYQETSRTLGVIEEQGELTMTDIITERVRKLDTISISDAMNKLGVECYGYHIEPISTGLKICDGAFAVHYVPCDVTQGVVGDFLDDVQPGQVVVTNNGSCDNRTVWDDIMIKTTKLRGIEGTAIDGACRDMSVVLKYGYPVFSKGYYMRVGEDRVRVDTVNTPAQLSGIPVYPGDVTLGDDTGMVAIPQDMVEEVARIAEEIEEKEQSIFKPVSQGVTLKDVRSRAGHHHL